MFRPSRSRIFLSYCTHRRWVRRYWTREPHQIRLKSDSFPISDNFKPYTLNHRYLKNNKTCACNALSQSNKYKKKSLSFSNSKNRSSFSRLKPNSSSSMKNKTSNRRNKHLIIFKRTYCNSTSQKRKESEHWLLNCSTKIKCTISKDQGTSLGDKNCNSRCVSISLDSNSCLSLEKIKLIFLMRSLR